jgi:predicted CopG family antitoxin
MSKYRNICVSESNYKILKEMGQTGDSFNDVLTKILKIETKKLDGDLINVK